MARNRGIVLAELIVATLVFATAMLAGFQAWRLCFKLAAEGREAALSSQIGRAELEMTKIQGFNNLPIGSVTSATEPYTGEWTEAETYYDVNGLELADNAPVSSRYYSSVRKGTDTGVMINTTGTTYSLASTTLRSVVVQVKRVSDGAVLTNMGVYLTRGGL
jgi:hypothetical protein